MKTKIRNSINGLLLIPLVLACFALLPRAQGTPDPGAVGGGNSNAADGFGALNATVSGINNSGFGANALHNLGAGNNNAAQGNSALFNLHNGNKNTALGVLAIRFNESGNDNTAVGYRALNVNVGSSNTAVGSLALANNTGGTNTAVGSVALLSNTGDSNTALGLFAGGGNASGSNNIYIGDQGFDSESNTIAIGAIAATGTDYEQCFIGGIFGKTVSGATDTPVIIASDGKLGTTTSSRRFKKDIEPMDQASEAILGLKPVTFHYKSDPSGTPRFGLVAEDVAEVSPDLIVRDADGQILSVRYDAVNAMLLNEFLKEHRKNEEQEATIARQQKQIDALTAGLQKVSAQLELNKPAPQTVVDSH